MSSCIFTSHVSERGNIIGPGQKVKVKHENSVFSRLSEKAVKVTKVKDKGQGHR